MPDEYDPEVGAATIVLASPEPGLVRQAPERLGRERGPAPAA